MIRRESLQIVQDRLAKSPAAALVGPRQSGKTTLAKSLGGIYFDLEQEGDRLRLDIEWESLVSGRSLVILDEAQAWPEVFTRLRGAIDNDLKRNGRFLLLGSVAPSLMVRVSESLAGRLAIVELTPFFFGELPTKAAKSRHWLCGGYPDGGVLKPSMFPRWQADYLSLLMQRDLPAWGLSAKPQVTRRLVNMLAAVHGQAWNASQIGQSLGLSYHTVNDYVNYLEGAFLIRFLPSFQENIRKRLTKSSKFYWRDSGLLHAILKTGDRRSLLSQPWVGASWEGYVIEQIIGALRLHDETFEAYYLRTTDQWEIDLVIERGQHRWAIEIKLTSSPGPSDLVRLNKAADLIDADRRILVSQTQQKAEGEMAISCNLADAIQHIID